MLRKVLIALGLGFCLWSALALGQPANDPAKAMAKYEEAERYYKLSEFETALGLYRESFLASGEPELLFNIGQCNRQLKRYEEALKSYKAYLRDVPSSPSRPEIEALIKEVEAKMGAKSQPTSEALSQPTSTTKPTIAPLKKNEAIAPRKKLTAKTLWKESTLVKAGVFTAGASFIGGGASLFMTKKANDLGGNILDATTQKQKALAVAFTSDATFLLGATCVGIGWFQLHQKNQQNPNAMLQIDRTGARVALSMEF